MNSITKKTFPTFEINLWGDANAFVKSWSNLYNYPNYEKYLLLVTKTEFEKGDLRLLFNWKNGMNLSAKKEESFLKNILKEEQLLMTLKKSFDLDKFKEAFGEISTIWQIFLLHIINPTEYPIFDQHVYRAFLYIQGEVDKPLKFSKTKKLNIYFREYHPFFKSFKKLAFPHDHFQVDKALWIFGKMLKQYPGMVNNNNQ